MAGVEASWHDLRRRHASVLLSAGVSPALVAERRGLDVKTLLATYAHVIRKDGTASAASPITPSADLLRTF